MTSREQLIQEIEGASDALLEEVLDFLLFIKSKRQKNLSLPEGENQNSQLTVLERMGGMPQHLIANGNLSDRDKRRAIIASRIQQSQQPSL